MLGPMSQPPDLSGPRWSPDRLWWWDGQKWLPANQPTQVGYVPPPPPPVPPNAAGYRSPPSAAPAAPTYWVPPPSVPPPTPSPGLRVFLLVVLIVNALITGLLAFGAVIAVINGATDTGQLVFLLVLLIIFALSLAATIGVFRRSPWARVAAIAAGVAVSLTCLGLVFGIPILIASARATLTRSSPPA